MPRGRGEGRSVDDLEALRSHGVSAQTLERLRALGLTTLRHLLLFNPEELAELVGLQDVEVAARIISGARAILGEGLTLRSARERIRYVSDLPTVKTGVEAFDQLTGGLRFGSSYEFAGEYGVGKSLMAMQVAVAAVAQHGAGVVYVDTEKTMDSYLISNTLRAMCSRFGVDYEDFVGDKLMVFNPATVDELEDFVKVGLAGAVISGGVRVVVVDSITALYRAQFRGRERLAERQQRLHYVLDWLRRLQIRQEVLVVYTNQVMTMPAGYVELKMPVGGNVLAHTVNNRWLMLRASKQKSEGVLRALDVPGVAPGTEVRYVIADDGLH